MHMETFYKIRELEIGRLQGRAFTYILFYTYIIKLKMHLIALPTEPSSTALSKSNKQSKMHQGRGKTQ